MAPSKTVKCSTATHSHHNFLPLHLQSRGKTAPNPDHQWIPYAVALSMDHGIDQWIHEEDHPGIDQWIPYAVALSHMGRQLVLRSSAAR